MTDYKPAYYVLYSALQPQLFEANIRRLRSSLPYNVVNELHAVVMCNVWTRSSK
jgi:hypothetical protein